MAPTTPCKRAKHLLKELWDLQKSDVPMTAATLLEVKYLLRSCRRCICVEIRTPKPRPNLIDPNPFSLAGGAVPRFILCQLLDQKLISSRNYQDTIALPAALSVISLAYATDAAQGTTAFPTQFRWHCSRTHRTHIIFAFLDVKMKSKIYSVDELLNLRPSTSPNVLAAVAFRDNELAEMLRTKSRLSSRGYNSNSLKRGSRRTMDDSSTTSDEVVFKGTMSRRAHRQEATLPAQPAQPAQSTQPGQPVQLPPAAAVDPTKVAASVSESDQPTKWKYRGRSGSEVMNNEPLSAPTGINAQQNEGFQRFYKAVVSPTHVRVTAGGRIVPNTRNPVSPTAKRPKDGESIANNTQSEPAPAAAPKQPMPVMGMPHPMQFFYPGFHPGMPPIHPMTGMPMPMMQPGFPIPMPVPNPAAAPANQDASLKENQAKKTDSNEAKTTSDSESAKAGGVKLSPPEYFDHNRPFMYNGQQWMFPMFSSPYSGFMGMAPPGYAGPPVPGAPMMMPPHMAMGSMMTSMGPVALQPSQVAVPPASAPASSRQSTPQPPSKPPISSIRPSQITRKQIDGLRANLKYHEDQVQYNKHQIDEKDMDNKIQMLQADIERFERVFKAQAEYEEKHYPKVEKAKEEVSSSDGRSSAPSTKTSQSQSEESKESKATTVTNIFQAKLRKKGRSRDSIGLNSNKSSTASYTYEEASRDRMLTNPGKKSTLPSGAALAPVFQPRSVSAFTVPITTGQDKNWHSTSPDEQITQEQLEETEKRLLAAGVKAWNLSQQVQELAEPASQSQSPRNHDNLGVPYLVGTLPRGVNPYFAHRIEYEYNRKLTDEEVQARHMYWGKAPRSVSQGLPKYDGKNFYPPSPVKDVTPNESPSFRRGRVPIGVPGIGYGFPSPNSYDNDPFRAASAGEACLKVEDPDNNSGAPSVKSSQSFTSQAEDHSEEFEKALAETQSNEVESEGTHSKDVSETRSADYHDPRANGTGSRLWQTMLKRGLTSSDVLPGTISSTTAHGYLPHFTGHAAASLNPTISGTISSPSRGSPSKDNAADTNGTSTFMTQKAAGNCPPATGERLSETLLNMVGMKAPAWAN